MYQITCNSNQIIGYQTFSFSDWILSPKRNDSVSTINLAINYKDTKQDGKSRFRVHFWHLSLFPLPAMTKKKNSMRFYQLFGGRNPWYCVSNSDAHFFEFCWRLNHSKDTKTRIGWMIGVQGIRFYISGTSQCMQFHTVWFAQLRRNTIVNICGQERQQPQGTSEPTKYIKTPKGHLTHKM